MMRQNVIQDDEFKSKRKIVAENFVHYTNL